MQKWYLAHREAQIIVMRIRRKAIRDELFAAYGGYKCACCGETNSGFLSIDHIDGGGNAHRRAINKKSGIGFLYWLNKHDYPSGFQVLCYNCNLGRAFAGGGICPHKLSEGPLEGPLSHYYKEQKSMKYKANPLGLLEGEVVWTGVVEKDASMKGIDVDSAPSFRAQVPVKEGLAGQDTFKMDASDPSSRADVELRRMHLPGGGKEAVGPKEGQSEILKGVNMYDEFGGGSGKSAGEFTENVNK